MAIDFNRANSAQIPDKTTVAAKHGQVEKRHLSQPDQLNTPPVAAQSADSVQISQTALELQSIADKLSQTPEVDSERVQQLKQTLDASNYQVDSQRVAERLLDFESLL